MKGKSNIFAPYLYYKKVEKMKMPKIILTLLTLTILIGAVRQVTAQSTVVSILPTEVTINEPGQTVTVDLNITDVTNMYAYEIKIWYKNNIVNATQIVRPAGHFLEPSDPANLYQVKWEIKNNFNATHGRLWLSVTLLAPEAAKTGSGILAKITFKGLAVGTTPVILNNYPGTSGPVKLADNTASAIPHTVQDGTINVIPEFSGIVLPIALIISAAAVVAAVLAKSKKQQKLN